MKKTLLVSMFAFGAFISDSIGQSALTPITIETATSIKPIDGKAAIFESNEDFIRIQNEKILELKGMIVKLQNEPSKVQFYREELWRYENAVINTNQ